MPARLPHHPAETVRLSSVMVVAAAMLRAHGPQFTARSLTLAFGWDKAFQALVCLDSTQAARAIACCLHLLVTGADADQLGAQH